MSNLSQVPQVTGRWGSFSQVIFGAWRLFDDRAGPSAARVAAKVALCLDHGITTFDHADIYGDYQCEALFGTALAELGKRRRDDLQLISKCGIKLLSSARPQHRLKSYDTSAAHIVASVEQSLTNLRTDYLDLLLIHRPDPLLAADEVAGAFADLHRQGKVRAFGVSNFTPGQLELLATRVSVPFVANQIEFSPLHWQPVTDGTLDQCQRLGLLPMAWSPLAGGRLLTDPGAAALRLRTALAEVAADFPGSSVEQVALAWIMRHPAGVLPVVGTGDDQRLMAAAKACAIKLDREQWHRIWSAGLGTDVP